MSMFAVQPQTVQCIIPGYDKGGSLIFRNDADDVAKSILEVHSADGDHLIFTFNTRGMLIEQTFVETAQAEEANTEGLVENDTGALVEPAYDPSTDPANLDIVQPSLGQAHPTKELANN